MVDKAKYRKHRRLEILKGDLAEHRNKRNKYLGYISMCIMGGGDIAAIAPHVPSESTQATLYVAGYLVAVAGLIGPGGNALGEAAQITLQKRAIRELENEPVVSHQNVPTMS